MAKQMYSAFDPMDPLDLCIMTDPNYDKAVDEIEKYTEAAAIGRDTILSEAYETEIGNDQFEAEVDNGVGYSEDGEDVDLPYDPAAEDAEDYSAAEMELLAGDFGHPIDSIDGLEFDM